MNTIKSCETYDIANCLLHDKICLQKAKYGDENQCMKTFF